MAFPITSVLILFCGSVTFEAFGAEDVAAPHLEQYEQELLGSLLDDVVGPQRLSDLEDALRPTFVSLPKNKGGRLEAAAVRYALHRVFVKRHGWSVSGLAPEGKTWNTSSPVEILRERLPSRSVTAFDQRLRERGFGLHDLAVFAATLESLIHKEATERTRAAYRSHVADPELNVTETLAERIVDTFMMSYIVGAKVSEMNPRWDRKMRRVIEQVFPSWPLTKNFVREQRAKVQPTSPDAWSFGDVEDVITLVTDGFGLSQNRECLSIKKQLVALEDAGTSCVGLNKFYGGNLNDGKWQFGENVDYLREAGILEESSPQHPKVIVANYMQGQSNCIATSSFYSVCCINECEQLMDHLEQQIAAPWSTPAEISRLVAALPSASVLAGRTLPPSLLLHLEEIAQRHGGQIPLHGRLFTQWMHYAYPQECPYPHVAGTTKELHVEDWEAQHGTSIVMSRESMSKHAESVHADEATGLGSCVPWTAEEELVVPFQVNQGVDVEAAWSVAASGVVLTAFASVVVGLVLRQKRALARAKILRTQKTMLSEV